MTQTQLRIHTNGKPIKKTYAMLTEHPELKTEMAHMHIEIGNVEVQVEFDNWQEMIDFCNEHNFEYKDRRPTEWVE